MEKGLNCSLMLSLQEIALRRVAVILWNGPDTLKAIGNFRENLSRSVWNQREWLNIVICITTKMFKLELPKSLQEKMMPILSAVGSEILKWKFLHDEYLSERDSIMDGIDENFVVSALEKLCWTTIGCIDGQKTAEELIRFDALDVSKRFELACIYCLEDSIPLLWNELPEESKITFFAGDPSEIEEPHLQLFLPHIAKKECMATRLPQRMDFSFYFEHFSFSGNKSLIEYCYRRLTQEEREESLDKLAELIFRHHNFSLLKRKEIVEKEKSSEIFCHLLSLVTPEEQIRIFKKHPRLVLECFSVWPWQDLFLDVADIMWTFLPETEYDNMMIHILQLTYNRPDFYFKNLYHTFVRRSPVDFSKLFLDEKKKFLFIIVSGGDSETVKTMFRRMKAADRARVVLSHIFVDVLIDLADMKFLWPALETCLREATLSQEDKRGLKEDFIINLQRRGKIKQMALYRRLFGFLDTTDGIAQTLT